MANASPPGATNFVPGFDLTDLSIRMLVRGLEDDPTRRLALARRVSAIARELEQEALAELGYAEGEG